MRSVFFTLRNAAIKLPPSTLTIAAGMALLAAGIAWPGVPAVTAFACVALGATSATVSRSGHPARLLPILLVHSAVYGSLYVLFVGAALHAAARTGAGLGTVAAVDLFASAIPMAFAVEKMRLSLSSRRSC